MKNSLEILDPKVLENLEAVFKDILSGDSSALDRPEFKGLNINQIKTALDFILTDPDTTENQKNDLLSNSWRLNYKDRPPTPEEFLSEKYLGPAASTIYPHIKKSFIEFLNPLSPYRTCVLYPHIGWGKSFLSVLINMYIGMHLSMMRAPWKLFGGSPGSVYTQVFCAVSQKKSSELLFEPMLNMLESSPFFEKIHTKEGMAKREQDFSRMGNIDRIFWTTATPTSALQFSGGANFKLIAGPTALLGQAQPLNCKIKKPDGSWITMGEVKIGDKIASPSEKETTVIGVFPQGNQKTYKITLEDGRSTKCNASHLWKIRYRKYPEDSLTETVVSLQFMLDNPNYEFYVLDEADCNKEL